MDLTPVVPFQHIVSVLSTCRPSSHGAVVLTKQEVAASRVEIKKKKNGLYTLTARSDLVLMSELCRLSHRHCEKTPPDNQVLFFSSHLLCH